MSEVIACANQKGGVGKTTTVVSLASYLALAGRNVLIVDLDPQGNATSGLGIDKGAVTASVYDALVGGMPMADLISPRSCLVCGSRLRRATWLPRKWSSFR